MKTLIVIGAIFIVLIVIGAGIIVYDNYKYPICDKCGSNAKTKRVKGKIICDEHGEIG